MALSPSRSNRLLFDEGAKSPGLWEHIHMFLWKPSQRARMLMVFSIIFVLATCIYISLSIQLQNGGTYSSRIIFDYLNEDQGGVNDLTSFSHKWMIAQASHLLKQPPSQLAPNFDAFSKSSGVNIWDMYVPTLTCPDVQRLGHIGEGGKWICGLAHLSKQKDCIIYSFGISTDISFEIEMLLRTQCQVFAFDPTIGRLPYHNLPPHLNSSLTDALKRRIVFNKVALATSTGSNAEHLLTEQLFDIMARYNHTFLNLVKMDIEGAEWRVFEHLSSLRFTKALGTLPIGQILIELHHHTSIETSRFFSSMHSFGLHPFSREINLIPCLHGQNPFAVEYSFINPANYFHPPIFPKPVPSTLTYIAPPKAVIYFLSMKSRVERLIHALQDFYDSFWYFYPHYPVLIFHDDMSDALTASIQQQLPQMPLRFIKLTFSIPEELKRKHIPIPERTVCDPNSSTLGYRHMCRFHAFTVHDYLSEYFLDDVEYVLRLDDDSRFSDPTGYDWFKFMKTNRKLYGFVSTLPDDAACVMRLWENARDFVNQSHIHLANDSFFHNWPDPNVVYNNFEISHMSVWKSDIWRKFRAYIDDIGGIYTLRWGDAPLHTIGVTMILNPNQIHSFRDIGYTHAPFLAQEAKGLPMPNMDPFQSSRMQCNFYDHWICHNSDSNYSFNASTSHHDMLSIALPGSIKYKQQQYDNIANTQRNVMYTFGHGGREDVLMATVFSFFTHYALTFPTPFVIFYSVTGNFDTNKVKHVLDTGLIRPLVHFVPVQLAELSKVKLDPYCSCADMEAQAASLFLRYQVFEVLKAQGYEWFFRFADESSLLAPIQYNVFERMKAEKKVYGYASTVSGRKSCIDDIWKLGREWTPGVLLTTSFEISHISVWQSFIARSVFKSIGDQVSDSSTLLGYVTDRSDLSANFVDSSLHTLIVAMTLQDNM
eukprot:gene30736-37137_t